MIYIPGLYWGTLFNNWKKFIKNDDFSLNISCLKISYSGKIAPVAGAILQPYIII